MFFRKYNSSHFAYQINIKSSQLTGLSKVKQHQLVYEALKGKMDGPNGALHALALTTKTPEN